MAWTCDKCTFINSDGSICKMCYSPPSESGVDSWTFNGDGNVDTKTVCEKLRPLLDENIGRGKRKVDDQDTAAAAANMSGSSNSLLQQLHFEKISRQKGDSCQTFSDSSAKDISAADCGLETIVVMTYNVWFREDLEVIARMSAIGELIRRYQPHIICLQEMTANIYDILNRSSWWKEYSCSVTRELASKRPYFCMQLSKLPVDKYYRNPFRNSIMGRELCMADIIVGKSSQLVVATTHLESPCPAPPTYNQMFSSERVIQAKESFSTLKDLPNAIFLGDMNWDDKLDGPPPLPPHWFDAWQQLHPDQAGLTYDSKANAMLTGSRLQKRLDRVFCRLKDFEVKTIEMIGTEAIPGVTYKKEKTVRKQKQLVTLPVLPSDHFGLVLKISSRLKARV